MIQEYILKKVLDASLVAAKKALKESGAKLVTSREEIEESITYHLRSVKNWSSEVSFHDLKKAKSTTDIFLELNLYVYPRRIRILNDEVIETIPLRGIFESNLAHFILLGQPGAGKTTSMMYLCQLLFHDEDFYPDRFSFPLLIKFRDLNATDKDPNSTLLIDQIFKILGLTIQLPPRLRDVSGELGESITEITSIKEKFVVNLLDNLGILLILEGFDELIDAKAREGVIREITSLATHLEKSTLILTSRTGDFIYNINKTAQYELCPLTRKQVHNFAQKWLGDDHQASEFLSQIYNSPFADTAIRPMTLAHLCAIYERIGRIPDKPKTIYKKVVNLLLEEWDQQRSIKRASRYGQFEVDRKFEFLCHLAYELTTSLQKTVFSKDDLLEIYANICHDYGLETQEAQKAIGEIESHTGLFLQSGYDQFEFAHKSLQEYLTAEYLVRLPAIPKYEKILFKLPNELAVAVAISSNQSKYFSELIINRLMNHKLPLNFLKVFMNRLVLEKPDFNTSAEVGLSLVLLYAMYVEKNILSGKHQISGYSNGLISEPENDVYSPLFSMGDLTNPVTLAEKLRDGDDPLSQYLRTQFTHDTQRLLQEYDGSNALPRSLHEALIVELNRLLQNPYGLLHNPDLFDEQLFAQVKLMEMARTLTNRKLRVDELIYLNRLLLEESYPHELAKSQNANLESSFYPDSLLNEFEKVMDLVLKRNTIDAIHTYYQIEHTYETNTGGGIYRLSKRKTSSGTTGERMYADAPEIIYLSISLWNKHIANI